MQEDWLVVGKIVTTQGIKGEVRVQSYSDFPERFLEPGTRWLSVSETAEPVPIELLSGRDIPGKRSMYVLRLAGIDTCNDAEALRGYLLLVPKSDRPPLAPNEYLFSDLVGCEVFYQPTGQYLGKVKSILEAGNDLLEVENERGQFVWIPFVEAIVPVVEIERQRLEITPPGGLVDAWLEAATNPATMGLDRTRGQHAEE